MTALATALRAALTEAGDPVRAAGMQAYLKSTMPCLGVRLPETRRLVRLVAAEHPLQTPESWAREVRAVWDGAAFREERHAAVELTGLRAFRTFQTPAALPLYEHLVVTGAWWDLVDPVATDRVNALAVGFPAEVVPVLLRWSRDDDMWRRRTAVLHQVGNRADTDTARLAACIEPSLGSREFFLRKAIGWALRDYAWADPEWVTAYVRAHEDRLSGLSRREALKNVARRGPLLAAEVTGE